MSDPNTTHEQHREVAAAFDRTFDLFKEYDERFKELDVNPFELFLNDRIYTQDYADDYITDFERTLRQWQEFMTNNYDRHPACPAVKHVIEFGEYYLDERDNAPSTVQEKLNRIRRSIEYFQTQPNFPHESDYNPIEMGKAELPLADGEEPKDPWRIPLPELRSFIQNEIRHIRDLAVILMGLKLGIRASELTNIKLSEIHIANKELHAYYDDFGSAAALEGRPNAVYIPPSRERNKRNRPTVLPLDDETRRILLQYLLVRPDNGEEWVFLSKTNGLKMDHTNINDVWKKYFRPKYGPTERYRGVSSHYGRHYMSTYLKREQNWDREDIKYLRGDKYDNQSFQPTREAIDDYIHTYYEDIETRYRDDIFKLRL